MNLEIERKFLLKDRSWKAGNTGIHYKQAYLNEPGGNTVRVRIEGEEAKLTIKSKSVGFSRQEFEYDIPMSDAEALFLLCRTPIVEKFRYKISFGGNVWEVDEFMGENEGLVVAEIELSSESQAFEKPAWIGEEVTGDKRYYNSHLARHPYCQWR